MPKTHKIPTGNLSFYFYLIKFHGGYGRAHQSRQTSMQDNNTDCLKTMYLPSRHNIRKFEEIPTVKKLRKDEVSKKLNHFSSFMKMEQNGNL